VTYDTDGTLSHPEYIFKLFESIVIHEETKERSLLKGKKEHQISNTCIIGDIVIPILPWLGQMERSKSISKVNIRTIRIVTPISACEYRNR
jgi:hypothetical protein